MISGRGLLRRTRTKYVSNKLHAILQPCMVDPSLFETLTPRRSVYSKQEAFEKCWAHSPLRAAARRLF